MASEKTRNPLGETNKEAEIIKKAVFLRKIREPRKIGNLYFGATNTNEEMLNKTDAQRRTYLREHFYESEIFKDIIDNNRLVVFGRKGTGKSTIAAQIEYNLISHRRNCEKAEGSVVKESENATKLGVSKTITFEHLQLQIARINHVFPDEYVYMKWKLALYLELLRIINRDPEIAFYKNSATANRRKLNQVRRILKSYGIPFGDPSLSRFRQQISIDNCTASVGEYLAIDFGIALRTLQLPDIIEGLEAVIKELVLTKTTIIIDELDSLLYKQENREDLSSLVKAAYDTRITNVQFIFMLRSDANLLKGSPLQRIRIDRSISIQWDRDSLLEMVNKRLAANNVSGERETRKKRIKNVTTTKYKNQKIRVVRIPNQRFSWDELFPNKVELSFWDFEEDCIKKGLRRVWHKGALPGEYVSSPETGFFEHILSYTLYRPRDIIAFLNYFKREYKEELRVLEFGPRMQKVLKEYMEEHFVGEVIDELRVCWGYDVEQADDILHAMIDQLGGQNFEDSLKGFTRGEFIKCIKSVDASFAEVSAVRLFRHLINMGLIGQYIERENSEITGAKYDWDFTFEGRKVSPLGGRYILHNSLRFQKQNDDFKGVR